jgi:hypothetical protein
MPLERKGAEDRPYYLLQAGEDYNWEGIPVHINSYGYRTPEFAIPKPPNTYRILNIGDSVVFGWEVRQKETYGQQLASLLNEQDDDLRYEVINAGVPGWNLETARNFLLQEGLSYQPDLVLLEVTVVNDIYGRSPGNTGRLGLFDWLRDNTYTWPFITTQARFLLARNKGPEAIPVLNPPKKASAYYPLDEDHQRWDLLWQQILEMQKAAQDQGVDFLLLIFPTALQFNSAEHPDVPQRVFTARAREAGIEFVDLLPIYKQECEQAAPSSCEGFENMLSADIWMHPTVLGHTLAAEKIAKLLDKSE